MGDIVLLYELISSFWGAAAS